MKNDSLNGVVNGDITPVAMRCVPAGSFSCSGWETYEKMSFEYIMQGTKHRPTPSSALMSRSRSSSRCEISVPSASFSGSSLISCRDYPCPGCCLGAFGQHTPRRPQRAVRLAALAGAAPPLHWPPKPSGCRR